MQSVQNRRDGRPVRPILSIQGSSQFYLIFGFQNASARRGFLTILLQVEAKDLCQRWTLCTHQERCGRLLQKTHFAAAHQVLQVALSSPPSPWQMFTCALCELLHILSPPVSVQPQFSSQSLTACRPQDQTDQCCRERVHRHVCAEPAAAPVGVSGQGVRHHGGGPRLQARLQTGRSLPDQWVTTLGTFK